MQSLMAQGVVNLGEQDTVLFMKLLQICEDCQRDVAEHQNVDLDDFDRRTADLPTQIEERPRDRGAYVLRLFAPPNLRQSPKLPLAEPQEEDGIRVIHPGAGWKTLRELAQTGASPERLVRGSITESRIMRRGGRIADAVELLSVGIAQARGAIELERTVIRELALVTSQDHLGVYRDNFFDELEQCSLPESEREALRLLIGARSIVGPGAVEAGERLRILKFGDADLDIARLKIVASHAAMGGEGADKILAGVVQDLGGLPDTQNVRAARAAVEAVRSYYRGDYESSAEMHLEAGRLYSDLLPRLSCYLNAGSAYTEIPDYWSVEDIASAVWLIADRHQLPLYKAFAHRLLRQVAYRSGEASEPDTPFIEALWHLAVPREISFATCTEASIAWRLGRPEDALELIHRAEQLTGPSSALLLRALAIACGDEREIDTIAEDAIRHPADGICIQTLGLLASSKKAAPSWVETALARSARIPRPEQRREVLSVREALRFLGA